MQRFCFPVVIRRACDGGSDRSELT